MEGYLTGNKGEIQRMANLKGFAKIIRFRWKLISFKVQLYYYRTKLKISNMNASA